MTIDMQSLHTAPASSIEQGRDSVDSVDCGAPESLQGTIDRLSETLKHLQRCNHNDEVQAVCGLLARAQGELLKVSARDIYKSADSSSFRNAEISHRGETDTFGLEDSGIEKDLAFLESIPTANLLNTCFEVQKKKHVNDAPDRCSSVSTMSSLGGCSTLGTSASSISCSPRTSLQSSPRESLMCIRPSEVDSVHPPSSPIFSTRFSIASARPSLPSFDLQPRKLSSRPRSSLSVLPSEKTCDVRSPRALFQVEGIENEESDDWELEFLRKAQLS